MARHARSASPNRRIVTLIVLALCIGLAGGTAAALAADESPSPAEGKVILRIGYMTEPDNLNPFIGYETTVYEMWHLNYEFLVGYNAEDGEPQPEIAESWEVSPDGKVWTFKIRQGMTWQDGRPVTAKDVAFTYNYIVDNNLYAFSTLTTLIKEAKVVDDYTVQVICTKPKANMLRLWIPIVPEHIWSKVAPKAAENTYQNKPPITGSGPFQIVEWKHGGYVHLVANKDYWRGAPTVDEIYFITYTNPDTMVSDLKSGAIDAAHQLTPTQFNGLKSEPDINPIAYTRISWEYVGINCYEDPASQGHPVLRDVKFRQALAWAVDRQKAADIAWSGLAEPGTSILDSRDYPADFNAHYEPTDEERFGFDLEKAKQLLDEAGYRDNDGDGIREYKGKPIELRLWSRTQSIASQKQGKFIAGWFSDIGLKIDYAVIDEGVMGDRLFETTDNGNTYAPNYDMYLWEYFGYADPGDTLSCFVTDQIWLWNDPCWSNAEFDRLAVEQYGEMDPQKRLDMLHRMGQIYYLEEPMIVTDYLPYLQAVNTAKWDGWVPYMDGGVLFTTFHTDSYLNLKPKTAAASEESSSSWWIAVVVAAGVAGGIVIWLVRRGRGRAVEE